MTIEEIYYQKGDFNLTQGAPGNQSGRIIIKGGTRKINRGTGWYEERMPSKLIVKINDNGKEELLNIAKEFHENIGKITQKRLDKIENIKNVEIATKENETKPDAIIHKMDEIIHKKS